MVRALQTMGPLAVGFKVEEEFRDYTDGVYNTTSCLGLGPLDVNHAVVAVGFDVWVDKVTGDETPYWIVKNSWGTDFGLDGYFYIQRGSNMCAIAECAAYPDLTGIATHPAAKSKRDL